MKIILEDFLLEDANAFLAKNHPFKGQVNILYPLLPYDDKKTGFLLSDDPSAIYPLQCIEFNGICYYIGLPRKAPSISRES